MLGLEPGEPIPSIQIESVKMGTTVATNALLERKGVRTALLINRGFADVLRIGTQQRPRLFDLRIELPEQIYERVIEFDGRFSVDRGGDRTFEVGIRPDFAGELAGGRNSLDCHCLHSWLSIPAT